MSDETKDAEQMAMRRLVLRRVDRWDQTDDTRVDVPDTKLTVILLRSNDVSPEDLGSLQEQAQAAAPDRKVIVLSIDRNDALEIYQEA